MKFKIEPISSGEWSLSKWEQATADPDRGYWQRISHFHWRWQAKRMARHLARQPEVFEV